MKSEYANNKPGLLVRRKVHGIKQVYKNTHAEMLCPVMVTCEYSVEAFILFQAYSFYFNNPLYCYCVCFET